MKFFTEQQLNMFQIISDQVREKNHFKTILWYCKENKKPSTTNAFLYTSQSANRTDTKSSNTHSKKGGNLRSIH